jgi:hypothetical protein
LLHHLKWPCAFVKQTGRTKEKREWIRRPNKD